MEVKKENKRTSVIVNNVVVEITTSSDNKRVWVDVYPWDNTKHAQWFINNEDGKQIYWKEYNAFIKP